MDRHRRASQSTPNASRLLGALATLVAAAGLVAMPQAAEAHPWGPYDNEPFYAEPRFAPNSNHVFCYMSLFEGTVTVADQARTNALGEPTHMTTERGCGGNTDVFLKDGDYGETGWRGYYSCRSLDANHDCGGGGDVVINIQYTTDLDQRRKTLCHEFGHSVGLRHDTDTGCMQSGPSTARRYTDHEERDHINVRY